ncbi:MAG TPA: TlpA disulfide reductase family protein [Gemmatimonadaceae bacterium]|nr:TlpA disulfide reductase family protein [Gemmatimonadaceae bacterium]
MIRTLRERIVPIVQCLFVAAATAFLTPSLAAQTPKGDAMEGRIVPTFAWPAMDDSASIVSPLSLTGSVVLIDLWGTWCAPCRREMPFLHDAYARFHKAGFEIVSVAFDVSPGKVAIFRRQFPMPWQHVYATQGIEAEATRIFRIDQFPRAILVDRDGTVLRVDQGLRGAALAATLDSVFSGRLSRQR